MVDVKRVTATVSKYYLYTDKTASESGYVKFNPTNNPPTPPGSPGDSTTVYSVDPFATLHEGPTALLVAVPFTRFYKIKCVIAPLAPALAGGLSLGSWGLIKTSILSTELLQVQIFRNGVYYQTITQGVYSTQGSILHSSEWISGLSYKSVISYTPATVEGTVELYAGDELRFYRQLTVNQNSYAEKVIYALTDGLIEFSNSPNGMVKYDNSVSASFFFEISEITDL